MVALNPEAERERLSRRLQELRAEMLRVKDAHPDLTTPQLVQKLSEHGSLRGALAAVVRDALRLGEVVNALDGAAEGEKRRLQDRSN